MLFLHPSSQLLTCDALMNATANKGFCSNYPQSTSPNCSLSKVPALMFHTLMMVTDKESRYVMAVWDNDWVGFATFKLCLLEVSPYFQQASAINDRLEFMERACFEKVTVLLYAFQLL